MWGWSRWIRASPTKMGKPKVKRLKKRDSEREKFLGDESVERRKPKEREDRFVKPSILLRGGAKHGQQLSARQKPSIPRKPGVREKSITVTTSGGEVSRQGAEGCFRVGGAAGRQPPG